MEELPDFDRSSAIMVLHHLFLLAEFRDSSKAIAVSGLLSAWYCWKSALMSSVLEGVNAFLKHLAMLNLMANTNRPAKRDHEADMVKSGLSSLLWSSRNRISQQSVVSSMVWGGIEWVELVGLCKSWLNCVGCWESHWELTLWMVSGGRLCHATQNKG